MTKVLLDTNVVLDVLLNRQPHVRASSEVWTIVETGHATGFIAAHAVTTLHHLIRREHGTAKSKRTHGRNSQRLLRRGHRPEHHSRSPSPAIGRFRRDSVTAAAAQDSGCDLLVTRDPKGFRGSGILCLTPEAAVPLFAGKLR